MEYRREKPGAHTPWLEVNQLLKLDERFDLFLPGWDGFLLAPRGVSQLAALLFFLRENQISYQMEGKGTLTTPVESNRLILSARAFSQITLDEDAGVVEAGTGAGIHQLHSVLHERRKEVNMEGDPIAPSSRSLGELLLSGQIGGVLLNGEGFLESLLGVEFVTFEGSQIRWGGVHGSSGGGPSLHKLLKGYRHFPGVLLKLILKTYPEPPMRLCLSWTFRNQQELWRQFNALKAFASTWERLDCVISGHQDEQSYILGQISGFKEEMTAFQQACPGYCQAEISNDGSRLKSYLRTQQLGAYPACIDQQVIPGEYLWYHGLVHRGWLLTNNPAKQNVIEDYPLWKQQLDRALGKSNARG